MSDRRRENRILRQVTLMLAGRLPAQTVDLGPTGFCAQMAQVFLPGSRVHGSLKINGDDIPFEGEVAWASPGDLRARALSRFGVRFFSPVPGLDAASAPRFRSRKRVLRVKRRPRWGMALGQQG